MSTQQSDRGLLLAPSSLKGDLEDALAVQDDDFLPIHSSTSEEDGVVREGSGSAAGNLSFSQTHPQLAQMPRVNSEQSNWETGSSKSGKSGRSGVANTPGATPLRVEEISVGPSSCSDEEFHLICRSGVGTVVGVRAERGNGGATHYHITPNARGLFSSASRSSFGSATHIDSRTTRSQSNASSSHAPSGKHTRPGTGGLVGVVSEVPDELSFSRPSNLRVRLAGVGLVKIAPRDGAAPVADPVEVGACLAPSPRVVGSAMKSGSTHPLAFAAVVEAPQGDPSQPRLVLARLFGKGQHPHVSKSRSPAHVPTQLPTVCTNLRDLEVDESSEDEASDNALLIRRGTGEAVEPRGGRRGRKRLCSSSCLFFMFVICALLAGSIVGVVQLLPHHHTQDVFHFSCNETKALKCVSSFGEHDNDCHALFSGVAPNDVNVIDRCCSSPLALSCYDQAFCKLHCDLDHLANPEVSFSLKSPGGFTPDTLLSAVVSGVNLTDPSKLALIQFSNGSEPNVDTPTGGLQAAGVQSVPERLNLTAHIWRAFSQKTFRKSLGGVRDMPWLSGGAAVGASLVWPEGWVGSQGSFRGAAPCQVKAGRDVFQDVCFSISGISASASQAIDISHFPNGLDYMLTGYLSATSGDDFAINVSVVFRSNSGRVLGSGEPTFFSPFFANEYFPNFVPFLWKGTPPSGSATADLQLSCHGTRDREEGRDLCDVTFAGVQLYPETRPCREGSNCLELRCLNPFNKTHSLCLTSDVHREPPTTAYEVGVDISGIQMMFIGGQFNEAFNTIGATLRGIVEDHPPSSVMVVDADTGALLPEACPPEGVCPLFEVPETYFRYDLTLAPVMDEIESKVFNWRIVGGNESDFVINLKWYAARKVEHAMDIT